MRKFEVGAPRTTRMLVQSLLTTSQESLRSRFRDSLPGGRRGAGVVNRIWGRMGLGATNEMRMAKEEKSAVIKIHERHIASVVVGRWLGAGARGRGGGGERGVGGGGRTGINRIVSIHPSGSSRDLDAPISSLHCLACRITRSRPLYPAHRRSLSLSLGLKNVHSPFS